MAKFTNFIVAFLLVSAASAAVPIDRHALVTRHNIEWNEPEGRLGLGNGEFCFGADGTGLQTFCGNSMAHWSWHSFPLPKGFTAADLPPTGNEDLGRIKGYMTVPKGKEALYKWMLPNPHCLNLGRLRLCKADGTVVAVNDIANLSRRLDLWSGVQTSHYEIGGQPVSVETCVHPVLDLVAVRIESPLVERGELSVALDFPYASLKDGPWVGDFSRSTAHETQVTRSGPSRTDLRRTLDATVYHAALVWAEGCKFQEPSAGASAKKLESGMAPIGADSRHLFRLSAPGAKALEFVCAFSAHPLPGELPSFSETQKACAGHWEKFWKSGGAIDLSASKDPRWKELERRIVLSQYLMAVNSAGSLPSAEVGLMGIDEWFGKFHMEMVWWHLAHYGLWDRWPMAEKALGCYQKFLPIARQLAKQFDTKGVRWGKMVGPEGRTSTWSCSFLLHWQQPHPIFLAELEYRLRPERATLEKWKDIVFETAAYMADYPTKDEKTGFYSLTPIMTAAENGVDRDPAFELAYWRFGLDKAQQWRERLGLPREPKWDEVRRKLAPLPLRDGVYHFTPDWTDTYTKRANSHPDPIGPCAFLPFAEGVDLQTAQRTVRKVWETWNWNATWGWDCPWMAMAAARAGQPQIAVEALLKDATSNRYPASGLNQFPASGPNTDWYLPGNGALLYAAAMMSAGWDGAPKRNAPGFPDDGQWDVRWEGLKPAP